MGRDALLYSEVRSQESEWVETPCCIQKSEVRMGRDAPLGRLDTIETAQRLDGPPARRPTGPSLHDFFQTAHRPVSTCPQIAAAGCADRPANAQRDVHWLLGDTG
jgi:hypothetical protein